MEKEETYVDFIIAPYCLAKLLWTFNSQKIHIFYITQVDDDLMVRIPLSHLEKVVYPHASFGPLDNKVCSPKKGD